MLKQGVTVTKVWTGTLVHNRIEILRPFLDALAKVECNGHILLMNNCDEDTRDLVWNWDPGRPTRVLMDNTQQSTELRSPHRIPIIAYYRNLLLEYAFNSLQTDHLFSVDSDILPDNEILQTLLSAKEDIIAALVRNDKFPWDIGLDKGSFFNIMWRRDNHFYRLGKRPQEGMNECGLTGAAYLISSAVFNSGVRYGDDFQGEDAYFCKQATEQGFKIYYHGDRILPHIMTDELLNKWRTDVLREENNE